MRFFFFVFSCLECECDPLQTQSQHTLFGFIGAGFSLCILIAKFNDINAVMSTVHLAMCSLVRFGLVFIFDYCARTRLRCDCAIVQCSPRYVQTNRLWPVCWIGPLVQVKCHFPSGKKNRSTTTNKAACCLEFHHFACPTCICRVICTSFLSNNFIPI